MEWLSSLAVVAVDGVIAPMALQLAGQLQGAIGAALAQAAEPGPEVIGVLQREPQEELQALLDLLEPMGPSTTQVDPTVETNTAEQDRISNGLGRTVASPMTGHDSFAGLKPKHVARAAGKTPGAIPWRF
jgi:hypothetical protein